MPPNQKRPRVVHVYKDVYPPVEGGIERMIHHLACSMTEEFEPAVITASRSGQGCVRTIGPGIEVVEVASLGRAMSTPLAPGFIPALRRSRADLFHFHLPHPTGEVAYLLAGLRTPAVATYHSDVVRQKKTLALYRPILDRFLRRMRIIMPTSRRYLETSETLAPHRDRCRVVPLGLPLEDYALNPIREAKAREYREKWGRFVFFIGVLRYYKGLNFLLDAIRTLPGAPLVIAGEGPEGDRLRAQAVSLGISDRVHFLGRVNPDDAASLLHAASVFCLPAHQRSEAFGLCQVEAMACGLPVVSTDLPTGVPEVNRNEESGLIVPPGNAEALASAIGRILNDETLAERLGDGGRRRATTLYSLPKMIEEVGKVYREALG